MVTTQTRKQPSNCNVVMGKRKIEIQGVTFQECESGRITGVEVTPGSEKPWIWPLHLLRNMVRDAIEMMHRKEEFNDIEVSFSYCGVPIASVNHHGVTFRAVLSMPVLVNQELVRLQEFCDTIEKEMMAARASGVIDA